MPPLPLQQSAFSNIVSFYKSVTVGSSETERRDRGTTREWKHRINFTASPHTECTPQRRMSDHTDGPEAAAAGKKRVLEGPGPQGKRRRHETSGGSPANAQGLVATAPASRPSAAKKPRKAPALCEHHRVRSRCKECGGSGICEHKRVRSTCKDCGGSSLCEHQRRRRSCKDCGGSGLCERPNFY